MCRVYSVLCRLTGRGVKKENEGRGKELYYEANISSRPIVTNMLTSTHSLFLIQMYQENIIETDTD
jgi:hypothetical protein